MKRWQVLYLLILGSGFVLGRIFSPIPSLIFIWSSIILTEGLRYWREIRGFGEETEN